LEAFGLLGEVDLVGSLKKGGTAIFLRLRKGVTVTFTMGYFRDFRRSGNF